MIDSAEKIIKDAEKKMEKAVSHFCEEILLLNSGRVKPNILNKLKINYYDNLTPVSQLAHIVNLDAQTLKISPYDVSLIKDISAQILKDNIHPNPSTDSTSIIIKFPSITQEHRKELIKKLHKMLEESKINIRNIRKTANNSIKKSDLTDNLIKNKQDFIQELTDKYTGELSKISLNKEKEIMTI